MSDVICDACNLGCRPHLEALNPKCGHLVHLCDVCYAEVGRQYLNTNPTSTPLDGSVSAAIATAAIAKARSEHVCGGTGCAVREVVATACAAVFGEVVGAEAVAAALASQDVPGVAEQPCGGCGADPCDGNQVCQCAPEADGDVTVYPTLRVVSGDSQPAPKVDPDAELRARSAEFLRDLLRRVEGGEFLYFAGVAWGKDCSSVFYSDIPSAAEAIGLIEVARAELVAEFFG